MNNKRNNFKEESPNHIDLSKSQDAAGTRKKTKKQSWNTVFIQALEECRAGIVIWLLSAFLFIGILSLYNIHPVLDPVLLYLVCLSPLILLWIIRKMIRLYRMNTLLQSGNLDPDHYPKAMQPLLDEIEDLKHKNNQLSLTAQDKLQENQDYFTLWAHDIKLPLAAMELLLQTNTPSKTLLEQQVKRIESSVSQAMAYIRLEGSDYQMQSISLEDLIRPVLRDHSSSFIGSHIHLNFFPSTNHVITDIKWARFILEQLLSNALKYSPEGSNICVYCEDHQILITDQGPGISPKDSPRIFEKGYTGTTGHQKTATSSGMGLYLSKKTASQIGCKINLLNKVKGDGQVTGLEVSVDFPASND